MAKRGHICVNDDFTKQYGDGSLVESHILIVNRDTAKLLQKLLAKVKQGSKRAQLILLFYETRRTFLVDE